MKTDTEIQNAQIGTLIQEFTGQAVAFYDGMKEQPVCRPWIYRCAESACPVFWKSPVRKEGITVPDKIMNAAETPS